MYLHIPNCYLLHTWGKIIRIWRFISRFIIIIIILNFFEKIMGSTKQICVGAYRPYAIYDIILV